MTSQRDTDISLIFLQRDNTASRHWFCPLKPPRITYNIFVPRDIFVSWWMMNQIDVIKHFPNRKILVWRPSLSNLSKEWKQNSTYRKKKKLKPNSNTSTLYLYNPSPPELSLVSFPQCTWGHNRGPVFHFPDGPAFCLTPVLSVNSFTPGDAAVGWTSPSSPRLTLTSLLLAAFLLLYLLFFLLLLLLFLLLHHLLFLYHNSLDGRSIRFTPYVFTSFVPQLRAILL